MTTHKIVDTETARLTIENWQKAGEKVVFTNGCFDILHQGHVEYLEKSNALGNKLVLGLNTDASVSRLKGPLRPVVNQQARARVMAALASIDLVVLFDEDTPLTLIQTLKPDILTKGNDYTLANIVGADFVIANGGEVKTVELVEGYSTTRIIEKIKAAY